MMPELEKDSRQPAIPRWLRQVVLRWRRNRLAREIRKDRRYFQPLGNGWWTTNRLTWQIKLLLAKPEKPKP